MNLNAAIALPPFVAALSESYVESGRQLARGLVAFLDFPGALFVAVSVSGVVGRFSHARRDSAGSAQIAEKILATILLRTCRPWLMPGISQKSFHSTIKGPAAEALDTLESHSRDLLAMWNTAIRGLGITAADFFPAGNGGFAWLATRLRASTFTSFRRQIEVLARELARRGVRINVAIAALNRLLEISVAYLVEEAPDRATPIISITRLHALIELLLVSGYTGQAITGKKSLIEASLGEVEHRVHGASAYVTRIYERERRRLSHDLHDEVGHDLILLKLYLEMISLSLRQPEAPKGAPPEPVDIAPRLDEAIGLVSHAIDSVRRLVLDLGPAVFDELGFLPALKSYAAQFSARTKINVSIDEGYLPEHVPLTHQIALYRLMQGALSNVLKHARASSVRISLGSMKDSVLIMVIEDDGIGFDTAAKLGRRSFGLTAMRERVEVLGGRIRVESKRASASSKKHGTRIEVELPLPGSERKSLNGEKRRPEKKAKE